MLKDQVSSRMKNQSQHKNIEENSDDVYQSLSNYIPLLSLYVSSPTLSLFWIFLLQKFSDKAKHPPTGIVLQYPAVLGWTYARQINYLTPKFLEI